MRVVGAGRDPPLRQDKTKIIILRNPPLRQRAIYFSIIPIATHHHNGIKRKLLHRDLLLRPQQHNQQTQKIKPLSELIGAFKTTSSKLIHQNGLSEFQWQRNYYDRIIRNEKELEKIRKYIFENPLKWELDRNNPENLFM